MWIMHRCCAVGCKNRATHLFPKDPKLRKLWKEAIGRKNFEPTKFSRLCTAHFKPEDYPAEGYYSGLALTRRILRKGAVPSVFHCSAEENIKDKMKHGNPSKFTVKEIKKNLALQRNKKDSKECCEYATVDHQEPTLVKTEPPFYEVEIEGNASITPDQNFSSGPRTYDVATQKNDNFFSIERFRNDDRGIFFYTGLESFDKFTFVFSTLCPNAYSLKYRCSQTLNISSEDQFLIMLIKLRRNTEDYEIGLFFDINPSSVSNIFVTWVNFVHQMWEKLAMWPGKDLVNYNIPEEHRTRPPMTRVIVEVPIQQQTNTVEQKVVWSCDRQSVTLEVGTCRQGSESDRNMLEQSSHAGMYNDNCITEDPTSEAHDFSKSKIITGNIPVFLKGRNQQSRISSGSQKWTSKKKYIDRLVQQIETYRFLQAPIHRQYVPIVTKIYFVCQMLCHFNESIVSVHAY